MSSYYDDDDELDIHVRRRHSPPAVRYVERPTRPQRYYEPGGPSFLVPEQRTTIVARSRSRSRDRRASSPQPPIPPVAPAAQPVIINNRFYNDYSSDDDDRDRRRHRQQLVRPRRSRSRSHSSRSRSRSRSRNSPYKQREEVEAELARRELERLRLSQAREQHERRLIKEFEDETELKNAKRQLDALKEREIQAEKEKRIAEELELKRLKKEQEEADERDRLEQIEKDAIERYKQQEMKRIAHEEKQKEHMEREYKRRFQEDLINSGLDEKAISAIINKQKVPEALPAPNERPTYTRMNRRHLSIETLRAFQFEYDIDTDPEFILVKQWVPEWQQDQLWKHTKYIREKRTKLLMVEEKKHHHHHHENDFEWVRKKPDRRRSKSPSLLMYLAGARPS